MYMQPIKVPTLDSSRSRPQGLKIAAGLLLVLVSAALVVPWTLALALWLGVAAAGRLIGWLAAFVHDTLLYAGEAVVGR